MEILSIQCWLVQRIASWLPVGCQLSQVTTNLQSSEASSNTSIVVCKNPTVCSNNSFTGVARWLVQRIASWLSVGCQLSQVTTNLQSSEASSNTSIVVCKNPTVCSNNSFTGVARTVSSTAFQLHWFFISKQFAYPNGWGPTVFGYQVYCTVTRPTAGPWRPEIPQVQMRPWPVSSRSSKQWYLEKQTNYNFIGH